MKEQGRGGEAMSDAEAGILVVARPPLTPHAYIYPRPPSALHDARTPPLLLLERANRQSLSGGPGTAATVVRCTARPRSTLLLHRPTAGPLVRTACGGVADPCAAYALVCTSSLLTDGRQCFERKFWGGEIRV